MKTFAALGSFFRGAREKRGYSLRHVAERVGINHSALARFEVGAVSLSSETIGRLRDVLVSSRSQLNDFITALVEDVPDPVPIGAVFEAEIYRALPLGVRIAKLEPVLTRPAGYRGGEIYDFVATMEDGSKWDIDVKVRHHRGTPARRKKE